MTASPSSLAPVVAQLAQIAAAAKLASGTGGGTTASGFADALRAASLQHEATDTQTTAQTTADVVTDAAALAGLVMPWIVPLVPAIAAGADALAVAADAIADAATEAAAGAGGANGRLADPGLSPAQEAAVALVRNAGPKALGAALAALDAAASDAAAVADAVPAPAPAAATAIAPDALVANLQVAAAALPTATSAPTVLATATGRSAELTATSTGVPGIPATDAAEPEPGTIDERAGSATPRAGATPAAVPAATEARSSTGSTAAAAGVAAAADLEGRKTEAAVASSPAAVTAPMAPAAREMATLVQAVDTQVAAPGWHEAVAQRLADFVAVRASDAEIRLNPANLGPIGVEISYKGNEASVLITAAQPATRDALEQALPHLRELLAQQGIALGQANVRDPGSGSAWAAATAATFDPDHAPRGDSDTVPLAALPVARPNRLIDTFA